MGNFSINGVMERVAQWILARVHPDLTFQPVPRGSCGVTTGPNGVTYFGPAESDWNAGTGGYAVLAFAMMIMVRDADLNRSISDSIIQAAIELGVGQDVGCDLAAAFVGKKELELVG